MSTELIVQRDNVELIINKAPQAYDDNKRSHDKCIAFGRSLLDTIEGEGMSDELDEQVAKFIKRARETVTLMNDRRTPVTKLFDQVRSAYTALENEVNPTSNDSVAYLLQSKRNEYAAQKRKEEEEKRKEAERLQRIENARRDHPIAVEMYVKKCRAELLDDKVREIHSLNRSITLTNFENVLYQIETYPETILLPEDINQYCVPTILDDKEAETIRKAVVARVNESFKQQYAFEVQTNKESILEMLPGKRKELEDIAKADEEEQRKRQEAMKLREKEEADKAEAERKKREAEETEKLNAEQTNVQMGALFNESAIANAGSYQPKTVVKKKITVVSQQGILEIVNLWWVNEGCKLSVEDLSKKFKSQITFCEKLANDKADPKLIESPHIRYEEDIKAK